jgi:hypothetical protein
MTFFESEYKTIYNVKDAGRKMPFRAMHHAALQNAPVQA